MKPQTQTQNPKPQKQRRYTAVVYEKGKVKRVVLYINAKPLVFTTDKEIKGVVRKRWKAGNTEAYSIRVSVDIVAQLLAQNNESREGAQNVEQTQHEQIIKQVVDGVGQGAQYLILTNSEKLAWSLYDMLSERHDVLPAALKIEVYDEELLHSIERALYMTLSKKLYDFMVNVRGVRRWPEDAGVTELRQLSYVLEAAGLSVLLIINNAQLVPDLGKLMDKIRELEEELRYAGVILIFHDVGEEELESIRKMLVKRGASRFISIVAADPLNKDQYAEVAESI